MNTTIIEMLNNEDYEIAIMGMPDTCIDYLNDDMSNYLNIVFDDKNTYEYKKNDTNNEIDIINREIDISVWN